MPEELILVTHFGSLRAGDLVVVKPCGWCGAIHRGMLLAFEADTPTVHGDYDVWTTTIPGHPGPGQEGGVVIAALVVERGIYRVQIPPAEETRETARPKTVERVR